MSSSPVLLYIVEENPEHRALLRDIVEPQGFRPRIFASSEDFLVVYERLSPGIVLLDLRLPGMGGASLVEELARRGCGWPVIILTAHGDAAEVERARTAGVIGILRKPIRSSMILTALQDARSRLAASGVDKSDTAIRSRFASLTPGQRAVLDGMREGLMNRQIARRCAISERSVTARVQQILKKTGAQSREHLIQLATTAGMLSRPHS